MHVGYRSAVGSHVGMVRSNNQDSGFAGTYLYLVADGMGGHAGGDVASAIVAKEVSDLDVPPQADPWETAEILSERVKAANQELINTVAKRPELARMGTTFTGFVTVKDQLALAHIGDSRLYLFRDGELRQITADHTFVQRLVETGKITEEEAKTHPRRSVLMRVLGDVGALPEIDTKVLDTQPGDVWLLCSDGLCGYVDDHDVEKILRRRTSLQGALDALIDRSLAAGAPDNVTVVLVETVLEPEASDTGTRELQPPNRRFVGSAATEAGSRDGEVTTTRTRLLNRRFQMRKPPQIAESQFEPRVDEYLAELMAETRRRNRRRRLLWAFGVLCVLAAIAGVLFLGYQWTQSRYYVGTDGDSVVIYRGVQQDFGSLSLHSKVEDTGIPIALLDGYARRQLEHTFSAGSLEEAREIVVRLGVNAERDGNPESDTSVE